MSEAVAFLVIFVVVAAVWIDAGGFARKPVSCTVRHEIERLHYQAAWLEERLELARRENWDDDTIASLEAELDATRQRWLRLVSRD